MDKQVRIDVENNVIGHLLVNGRRAMKHVLSQGFTEDHFDDADQAPRLVFKALHEMYKRGDDWQADDALEYLEICEIDTEIVSWANSLTSHEVKNSTFRASTRRLTRLYKRQKQREALSYVSEYAQRILDDEEEEIDLFDALTKARKIVLEGDGKKQVFEGRNLRDSSETTRARRRRAKEYYGQHGRPEKVIGYFDLPRIDDVLDGLVTGRTLVIGGSSGSGKTTLAQQLINAVSGNPFVHAVPKEEWKSEKPDTPLGLLLSLELSQQEVEDKFTAMHTAVNADDIYKGSLTDEEWDKVDAFTDYSQPNCIVVDDSDVSLETLEDVITEHVLTYGVNYVVLDYIQIVNGTGNQFNDISETSRVMTRMAKKHDIACILISQLSRPENKRRQTQAPTMASLRGSGQIEQDAYQIFLLWPQIDEETGLKTGVVNWAVDKSRFGVGGTGELIFSHNGSRFIESKVKDTSQYSGRKPSSSYDDTLD